MTCHTVNTAAYTILIIASITLVIALITGTMAGVYLAKIRKLHAQVEENWC